MGAPLTVEASRGRASGGRGTRLSSSRAARLVGILVLMIVAAVTASRIWPTGGGDGSLPVGRPDPAVEITRLEARLAADPDDGPAWQRIAAFYLDRAAGRGDAALVDQAEHAVAEAVRLRPDDLATYRAQGALALTLHQFDAAHRVGLAAREAHPDAPDALTILVDSSIELGRYDEAKAHLRQLLERRPDAAALARVSYLREIHGDLPGARLAMTEALTAAEGDDAEAAAVAVLVGDLALAAGDLEQAQDAYQQAEQLDPGNSLATLGTARTLAVLDQTDSAIGLLEQATTAFPEPALLTLLGELYESQGQADLAESTYRRTGALIDQHGAAGEDNSLEAARFHADHGDPATALRFAEFAYRNRPTVFAADALGWALTLNGQPADAIRYIEEAQRLGTSTAELHVHAALTYVATGDTTSAAEQLTAALDHPPLVSPQLLERSREIAAQLDIELTAEWEE
jgi:tetratricopeptide (TPR) repeat protein